MLMPLAFHSVFCIKTTKSFSASSIKHNSDYSIELVASGLFTADNTATGITNNTYS